MERGAEEQVVAARQLFVDALDEVVLDGNDRQRARADVRPEISLFPLEKGHSRSSGIQPWNWLRDYTIHWSRRRYASVAASMSRYERLMRSIHTDGTPSCVVSLNR